MVKRTNSTGADSQNHEPVAASTQNSPFGEEIFDVLHRVERDWLKAVWHYTALAEYLDIEAYYWNGSYFLPTVREVLDDYRTTPSIHKVGEKNNYWEVRHFISHSVQAHSSQVVLLLTNLTSYASINTLNSKKQKWEGYGEKRRSCQWLLWKIFHTKNISYEERKHLLVVEQCLSDICNSLDVVKNKLRNPIFAHRDLDFVKADKSRSKDINEESYEKLWHYLMQIPQILICVKLIIGREKGSEVIDSVANNLDERMTREIEFARAGISPVIRGIRFVLGDREPEDDPKMEELYQQLYKSFKARIQPMGTHNPLKHKGPSVKDIEVFLKSRISKLEVECAYLYGEYVTMDKTDNALLGHNLGILLIGNVSEDELDSLLSVDEANFFLPVTDEIIVSPEKAKKLGGHEATIAKFSDEFKKI